MTSYNADWLSPSEIKRMPFVSLGENVLIDRRAILIGIERISIGSQVRIDADCMLNAGDGAISLGSWVHLGRGCLLVGGGRIALEDFAGLSADVAIFSQSDDFTGGSLTNATIPKEFSGVTSKPVTLAKHALVGRGATILPGADLGEGARLAANSVLTKPASAWRLYRGNPAEDAGRVRKALLAQEQALLERTRAGRVACDKSP